MMDDEQVSLAGTSALSACITSLVVSLDQCNKCIFHCDKYDLYCHRYIMHRLHIYSHVVHIEVVIKVG